MPLALVPPPHANPAPTQVEYYFSEANLSGDQFMRDKIAADGGGFVKLSLINSGDSESRVTLKFPGRVDLVVTEADAASAVGKLMSEVVPPGHGAGARRLLGELGLAGVGSLVRVVEAAPSDGADVRNECLAATAGTHVRR